MTGERVVQMSYLISPDPPYTLLRAKNAESTALICDLDNGRRLDVQRIHAVKHLHRTVRFLSAL